MVEVRSGELRRLPPLRSLQAFEAAARLGSILRAAAELRVTPSAISHQIKQLEGQLGIQLFHRAHRSVILTDLGRQYARGLGSAFKSLEEATRAVAGQGRSDILSIHVVPSLAAQWLMPRLARFTADNPHIDVRLHASHSASDLLSGEVDVEIRYGPVPRHHGTVVIPFPPEAIVVFCAPGLTQGPQAITSEADLAHHPLIHSEVNLYGWREWQQDHPGSVLRLDRGPRFDRSFMSISEAVDGRGVCLESWLLVQRELASGSLVAPLGTGGPRISCHTLVYQQAKAHLPKVARFAAWLHDLLSASEGVPASDRPWCPDRGGAA